MLVRFIIILTLLCGKSFSQKKTSLEVEKLAGKVKSVRSYSKHGKSETFYYTDYYNEGGMIVKRVMLNYDPDSVLYQYDDKNRLILQIKYERKILSQRWEKEVRTENDLCTITYLYNDECYRPVRKTTKFRNSGEVFDTQYILDASCRIVEEVETGRGRTNITHITFDHKDRMTKKVFTYAGSKPDKVETFDYDDARMAMKYLEYNPRYYVYRNKEIRQFNANDRITERKYFYAPNFGGSITFTSGASEEPDSVYLTKRYIFNDRNKLTEEIHIDGNGQEVLKVVVLYNEAGECKEQLFYNDETLSYREEYTYKDDLLVEEKKFQPTGSKPDVVKTWNYNESGKLLEYKNVAGGNTYTKKYIYDSHNNEIEAKSYRNRKLTEANFTEIVYYSE